jgi:hypothetical protein
MNPYLHGLDLRVESHPLPYEERSTIRRGAPERLRIAPLPPHLPRTWCLAALPPGGARTHEAPGTPGVPTLAGLFARWRALVAS